MIQYLHRIHVSSLKMLVLYLDTFIIGEHILQYILQYVRYTTVLNKSKDSQYFI